VFLAEEDLESERVKRGSANSPSEDSDGHSTERIEKAMQTHLRVTNLHVRVGTGHACQEQKVSLEKNETSRFDRIRL
jgi:hypothetical protein